MSWHIDVIEPTVLYDTYKIFVRRPAGFKPGRIPLVARNVGPRRYQLDYEEVAGYPAGIDQWDSTVVFTGKTPLAAEFKGVTPTGIKVVDTPILADGSGGGPGSASDHSGNRLSDYTVGLPKRIGGKALKELLAKRAKAGKKKK